MSGLPWLRFRSSVAACLAVAAVLHLALLSEHTALAFANPSAGVPSGLLDHQAHRQHQQTLHRRRRGSATLFDGDAEGAVVREPGDGRGSSSEAVTDATPRKRQRAGFSLLRCDAYHCERESVREGKISFTNPATNQVMLVWEERPRRVLVLLKPEDELLLTAARAIDFLQREMKLEVVVEEGYFAPLTETLAALRASYHETPGASAGAPQLPLEVFVPPHMSSHGPGAGGTPVVRSRPGADEGEVDDSVDLVVTLGGDGLMMHSSTLFRQAVPPHLCFNLGSMGFLTPFDLQSLKDDIRGAVDGAAVKISLRMRLSARIVRAGKPGCTYHALNEVVVERGGNPHLSLIECFCDDQFLTTVQADGLIIATPTGSTAYSMSAGGSMVHPSVPAILFTPICPHSLSFRPLIFPDSVVFRCDIPEDGRAEGVVSFDGKNSQPLKHGDALVIKMSSYPVPTICKDDSTADWFSSLDSALGFNVRVRQKAPKPSRYFNTIFNDLNGSSSTGSHAGPRQPPPPQ